MQKGLSKDKKGSEEEEEAVGSDPIQETKWLALLSVFLPDLPHQVHRTLGRASSSGDITPLQHPPGPPEKEAPQSAGWNVLRASRVLRS